MTSTRMFLTTSSMKAPNWRQSEAISGIIMQGHPVHQRETQPDI